MTDIKKTEMISTCTYCKQLNTSGNCARCEYLVDKFTCCVDIQEKDNRKRLLSLFHKINGLVQDIIESKDFSVSRSYNKASQYFNELLKLLLELKPCLSEQQFENFSLPEITKPTKNPKVIEMLEELLFKIKYYLGNTFDKPTWTKTDYYKLSSRIKYDETSFTEILNKNKEYLDRLLMKLKHDIDVSLFSKFLKHGDDAQDKAGFRESTSIQSVTQYKSMLEGLLLKIEYDKILSKQFDNDSTKHVSSIKLLPNPKKEQHRIKSQIESKHTETKFASTKNLQYLKGTKTNHSISGLPTGHLRQINKSDKEINKTFISKKKIGNEFDSKGIDLNTKKKKKNQRTRTEKTLQSTSTRNRDIEIKKLPVTKTVTQSEGAEKINPSVKSNKLPKITTKTISVRLYNKNKILNSPSSHKKYSLQEDKQIVSSLKNKPSRALDARIADDGVEDLSGGRDGVVYEAKELNGILYKLSDSKFIENGWTLLPKKKTVRKVCIYKLKPASSHYNWFQNHREKDEIFYESGERLAKITDDNQGQWFYKSGDIALDSFTSDDDLNVRVGHRYVVYNRSDDVVSTVTSLRTILASFDTCGNGVVYDRCGNVRIKYNQFEGILYDKNVGPKTRWKWHSLNDPPELKVMDIENFGPSDSKLQEIINHNSKKLVHPMSDLAMNAAEEEHVQKLAAMKVSKHFEPFQIRMKTLKLNENFSLRVIDQSRVYVTFRDGAVQLKLNVGMNLINEQIDTQIINTDDVVALYPKLDPMSQIVENKLLILNNVKKNTKKQPA